MQSYKKAFLFNGIGSKFEKIIAGMPQLLIEKVYSYRADTFAKMSIDMNPDNCSALDKIVGSWITSSVCDRVIFEYYAENDIHPDICAGYSSGIVSISACLSVVPFDFSYEILKAHSQTITELQKNNIELDMGIIIGLDYDTVQELIDSSDVSKYVVVGSVNSKICVMISGYRTAVENILESAVNEGAIKAIQMKLPIAFHNTYIEPYCRRFQEFCSTQPFANPPVPVVSAVDQRLITTGADMLYENQSTIVRQMHWDMTIEKLQELGVTEIYDVSADCSVKKFSKWNKKKSDFFTYLDI